MNVAVVQPTSLPILVDRAAQALAGARSSAEILEARDMASFAYDAAKKAARLAKAKDAHDILIAAAYRAQADALEIESQAKRRLADEYDAAQERGEVRTRADNQHVPPGNKPTVEEIGLTRKQIHEARQIRDAEKAEPGIIRRALDERLRRGEEPTKAALRHEVEQRLGRAVSGLRQAERELAEAERAPKAAPLSDAEIERNRRIFGTQEDRAIVAALGEITDLISEQPSPAEAVRRVPAASRHAIATEPIRAAARWLSTFCDIWDEENADDRQAAE